MTKNFLTTINMRTRAKKYTLCDPFTAQKNMLSQKMLKLG